MANTLFILNDPPYGTERSDNARRLAGSLSKRDGEEVKVFLIGDASSCAKRDQKVPQGYYNADVMLRSVGRRGGEIGVCATCMDARGITDTELTAPHTEAPLKSSATGCSGRTRLLSSDGRRSTPWRTPERS
jgi:uncharacterized protein involved in oxidation of intracellular sulfur